jgi:hypothetical protein
MALGDPEEFQAFEPWSWLPKEWETTPPGAATPLPPIVEQAQAIEAAPPVPAPVEQPALPPLPEEAAPMQPGLGLPAATVDTAIQTAPQVDAVSGVDAMPPMPAMEAEPEPEPQPELGALPSEPSPYFDPLDPSTFDNPLGAEDLYAMAKRDPIGYAQHNMAAEQARMAEERDRVQQATDEYERGREQDHRDRMDLLNESERRRQKLLDAKIDPGRHMRNMSVPQSIASFLSVVVGGLVQARKGGPNIGLEMLDRAIDRDIAAQQANISNERNALADFERTGMTRIEAAEAYRIGSYKQAIAGIQTKMQDYDPAGTTARNLAQQALEIEGRMAQAAETSRRSWVEEEFKRREDARKTLETQAKLREADAKYAAQMAKLGGGAGRVKPEDAPQPIEYFKARYPNAPAPPVPMSEKEYVNWLKTTKTGAEASQAVGQESPEKVRDRELGVGWTGGDPFVNKDGKPFHARSAPVAEKLTKQANAAREVVDIIDEILAIRDRSGGESSLWNSDDRQRLDVLQNRLIILEKSGTEGMSSDEDMKKLAAAAGAADVASFRAKAAGLEKGRERTIGFLNQTLQSNQYTGKPVSVPNRFNLPKPKQTASAKQITKLVQADQFIDPNAPIASSSPAVVGDLEQRQAQGRQVQLDISDLRDEAKTNPAALKSLDELAKNAVHPLTKAWAAEAAAAVRAEQEGR